jgi:hypothetical protein
MPLQIQTENETEPDRDKLGKLFRLLNTDNENEALETWRAIKRLAGQNNYFNEAAKYIEAPPDDASPPSPPAADAADVAALQREIFVLSDSLGRTRETLGDTIKERDKLKAQRPRGRRWVIAAAIGGVIGGWAAYVAASSAYVSSYPSIERRVACPPVQGPSVTCGHVVAIGAVLHERGGPKSKALETLRWGERVGILNVDIGDPAFGSTRKDPFYVVKTIGGNVGYLPVTSVSAER